MHGSAKRAFTLIELLVVIAIIAILAAILFPVFAQARAQARKTVCLSNFKQEALGILMYQQDYDEYFVLTQYHPGSLAYTSPPDMERDNLLYPYMKNYQILDCPSDPANDQARATQDGVTAPTTQQQWNFNLAVKDDFGYNWQYLSPIIGDTGCAEQGGAQECDKPVKVAQIAAPAHMILGVDCLWDRNGTTGAVVVAGGNDAVDPPCHIEADGSDSFPYHGNMYYYWYGAWNPTTPLAWNVFGGVWPWHGDIVNTAFVDGHCKPYRVSQLAAGCNVKDSWGGVIYDDSQYLWSGKQ